MKLFFLKAVAFVVVNRKAILTVAAGVVLGAALTIAIAGYVRVSNESTKANERAAMAQVVAASVAELQQEQKARSVTAARNRTANVYTWCTAINNTRDTITDYLKKYAPKAPKLNLQELDCKTKAAETKASGSDAGNKP